MNAHSLPLRTSICLLAVLLTLTPISQVMAQTAQQQEQQSEATQSDKQDEETDKAAILRPNSTTIFPKGDSIPVADSAAAIPAPAARSTGATVALVVLALAVVALIVFLIAYRPQPIILGA